MTLATWIPSWYELDAPLRVGDEDDFYFWRNVPTHLCGSEALVFYNSLWRPEDVLVAHGTVVAIVHPELGSIHEVDTRGLDYTITLADGVLLKVDAEENPGLVYEFVNCVYVPSPRKVTAWRFAVNLQDLSDPAPPPVPFQCNDAA
jgi:hypothetical protein